MAMKRWTVKFEKLEFNNNHLANQPKSFPLIPDVKGKTGKLGEHVFFIELILALKNTEEHPFPYDIAAVLRGVFEFEEADAQSEIDGFLVHEGIGLIYPYLRSAITALSSAAMVNPIIIPIIDPRSFFEETTNQPKE